MPRVQKLIPTIVNCVANVKPPKKPGRPVVVELNPNFEILSQMRNLTIQFLDNNGQCSVWNPMRWIYEVDCCLQMSRLRGLCPATVDGSYDWMKHLGGGTFVLLYSGVYGVIK